MNSHDLQPDRIRKVRVLVLGDSCSGKTSLVHLLVHGEPLRQPKRTVGCSISVKLIEYPEHGIQSEPVSTQPHFVELWDVGTHDQYSKLRSIFYSQINGVILVHDLSSRRSARNLHRWAGELLEKCTFSAAVPNSSLGYTEDDRAASTGLYGLPVPALVIGNKSDVQDAHEENKRGAYCGGLSVFGSISQLFFGRPEPQQSLLPVKYEGNAGGMSASALRGVVNFSEVDKFFHELITRRYYSSGNGIREPNHTPRRTLTDGMGQSPGTSQVNERRGAAVFHRSISFTRNADTDASDDEIDISQQGGRIELVIGDAEVEGQSGILSPIPRMKRMSSLSSTSPNDSIPNGTERLHRC
mmetsp:Transcript_17960/g.34333  ORF Transcript_17960/g.34333 Transcript_17960/m.34333 type:complete len:355 (+) Transcript_17960:149-1213(+)